MDMGSNLQWSTASTITSWHHFHPTITKDCQKSDPVSAVERCKGALICLHTSLKGEKHFTNVHYGCGKQSKVDYSLNHDIMVSFPLDSHPELLKTYHSGFSNVTV